MMSVSFLLPRASFSYKLYPWAKASLSLSGGAPPQSWLQMVRRALIPYLFLGTLLWYSVEAKLLTFSICFQNQSALNSFSSSHGKVLSRGLT